MGPLRHACVVSPRSPKVRTVTLEAMMTLWSSASSPAVKDPLVEVGPNGELIITVASRRWWQSDAVARLLAAHLQLPRAEVKLVSGATSRFKKRFRLSR